MRVTATRSDATPAPPVAAFRIGAADDAAEREADAMADRALAGTLRRRCRDCEAEEKLSRRTSGSGIAADAGQAVTAALAQPGRGLGAGEAAFYGSRFGTSFDTVRLHEGPAADHAARSVGARAFALGNHVVFAQGEYRQGEEAGRRLLAHELAHVIQSDGVLRRQGGGGCAVEICFVPIRMPGLQQADARHAVVNLTLPGGVQQKVEVDPAQDQGVQDPAAAAEGPGRAAGLHSHVAIGSGHRTGGTCTAIPASCAEAQAVLASARRYDALDVVYEPPPGPNSNSFGEWVLTDAGLSTAGVNVPTGALGWGYYASNPGDRASPPHVARTARGIAAHCSMPVRRATTFQQLVDLVRAAETQLIANGVTDVGERVSIIRGIYYGTPWSKDFGTSESSHVRNQMFNVYSGTAQPRYPLDVMDCGTALSLGASQDVQAGPGLLDVGHMFIGMDARRSVVARTVTQPVGLVTGLEAATWAGDLGGGAARLAMRRTADATYSALNYFSGTNYGGPINLEGDVAGYAVAAGSASGAAPPLAIPPGGTIADALADYLLPPAGGGARGRDTRCSVFLQALGGTIGSGGTLSNRATVLAYIAEQIGDFGCAYMLNYMRQHGGVDLTRAEQAAYHLEGAANEMAELFLAALERCMANPGATLAAGPPVPAATPRAADAACGLSVMQRGREAAEAGREALESARQTGEEVLERGREAAREAQEAVEGAVDRAESWIEQQRQRYRGWWQ